VEQTPRILGLRLPYPSFIAGDGIPVHLGLNNLGDVSLNLVLATDVTLSSLNWV
jgi:hypothetical protein